MRTKANRKIAKKSSEAVRLGKNIRMLRKSKKWTQKEFAAELGVNFKTPNHWESGRQLPSHHHLVAIANLFDIRPEMLLEETVTQKMIEEQRMPTWDKISDMVDGIPLIRFSTTESMENTDFKEGCALWDRSEIDCNHNVLKGSRMRFYNAFKCANLLTAAVNTLTVLVLEYCFYCFPNERLVAENMTFKEYQIYLYSEKYLTEMKRHRVDFFNGANAIIDECLYALKNSEDKDMREVGNYYAGLVYFIGMVDVDTPREMYYATIGGGMHLTIVARYENNPYAEKVINTVGSMPDAWGYITNCIEKNLYSIE